MERKPYYVLQLKTRNFVLHEGIVREIYPHCGMGIQLYLTDAEIKRYDGKKVYKVLEPYYEIMKNRYMYLPPELILYAIEEVLYEDNKA